MRMIRVLLLAVLVMLAHSQTSLCQSCATSVGSLCVACNAGGCRAYATVNTDTNMCECDDGYYLNSQDSSQPYCGRCFIGCKTCSGEGSTQCLSCMDGLTFDSATTSCQVPYDSQNYTISEVYGFYGFGLQSGWSVSSGSTSSCGTVTTVGRGSVTIYKSWSSLQTHWAVRTMFAHYMQDQTNVNSNVRISVDGGSNYNSVPVTVNTGSSFNPTYHCSGSNYYTIQNYVDASYTHSSSTLNLRIQTANSIIYGIREFILILKLCHSDCSSCTGYLNTQCTGCTDSERDYDVTDTHNSVTVDYTGQCVCKNKRYAEPVASQCVDLCPSVPTQTFGDNHTRQCLTSCPNNSYADTDKYLCLDDCPTTSSVTGALIFRDQTNWKCVPNCPSTEPYASHTHRICYLNCPNVTNGGDASTNYYTVDGFSKQCVSVCPHNTTFFFYAHQGKCIPRCPDGFYGDPGNIMCVTNCDNSSAAARPFKDTSAGIRICVANCSQSNYFRDNTTFTCVDTCPSGTYGETDRQCVTRCKDGSFGLPFGNRKCVAYCPEGYWGEPDTNVCVNDPTSCETGSNKRYGDDYTRTCVFPTSCSLGYYADNSTMKCVQYCPSAPFPNDTAGASVGHPVSKVCQAACATPYFADYVAGLCVTACVTNNTYTDVDSSRTCVLACNPSGSTPWADNNTWTCVNDCNNTGVATLIADNTTWQCVYYCPPGYYADRATSTNPICRPVCLTGTYGRNTSGSGPFGTLVDTGTCEVGCPAFPPRFGDAVGGINLCVEICTSPNFGDITGNRLCVATCPSGYYSQNNTGRQCINVCNDLTYGQNRRCLADPHDCPVNQFGNDATNLCEACDADLSTWGDPVTKTCVSLCPLNPAYDAGNPDSEPITYYADYSLRQCVKTCSSSYTTGTTATTGPPHSFSSGLYGNNDTRTCVFTCSDINSFAEVQANNVYRVCVAKCFHTPVLHFANNVTKVCGPSIDCPDQHFGQNTTQVCVENCPDGTFGFSSVTQKTCIDRCPSTWYGQNSTGVNICVQTCTALPSLFADDTTNLCVARCPVSGGTTYFADPTTRTCVQYCPAGYYAYTPDQTCVDRCPDTYYGFNASSPVTHGQCVTPASACASNSLVADSYLNLCVPLCTGPTPVNTFQHSPDCVEQCPPNYFSNIYSGVRNCVLKCPPTSSGTAAPDLYGDNSTKSCVSACVSPNTWADYQTRYCQPQCSSLPDPTYSQNFNYRCVISLNCPTSPVLTFGDNNTRTCSENCSNGQYGDPTSRNCVTQCPNNTSPHGTTYYSDISTGLYLCVYICPELPRLFGYNTSNECVQQCPQPLYGDQTGNRSCLAVCPLIGVVVHFAQNTSRICVTVCQNGTWGKESSRQCVQDPFHCGTQWADDTTNLCVDVCPATAGSFGDPTTKKCVTFCPPTYYSDYSTRTCVQTCPSTYQQHGTFANNQTRTCQEVCQFVNTTVMTFADPQTTNRFCVLQCLQSPQQSFADPSTQTCVPICPVFPSLFAQQTGHTCVASCPTSTYGDTHTRRCQTSCPGGEFKSQNPNLCVSVCPFDGITPMYGDSNSGFCESVCTNSWYRYDTQKICVSSCASHSLFAYNMTCTKFCPSGYYADGSGICVSSCPSTTFGQNTTTACTSTCVTGYAHEDLCIAECPTGYYGENKVCVTSCQVPGNTASNVTHTCVSNCHNGTFAQSGQCTTNCTSGTYADPLTHLCSSSCTGGAYADPSTNTCVDHCPPGYYINAGNCLTACSGALYADNITWSCVVKCSTGYWGHSNLCLEICPTDYFGYLPDRICYNVPSIPQASPLIFADNNTQTWLEVCPLSPLTFGDKDLDYCVTTCPSGKFSDPTTRKCQTGCQDSDYFADETTNSCVMVCPEGYFANSNNLKCEDICTAGYAYDLQHTCVATCPNPYSGYNNGTANICVQRCPNDFYSHNRVCGATCPSPYYADNTTNYCAQRCVESFASDDARKCVSVCSGYTTYDLADNSTNMCVSLCPTIPDYYEENGICVLYCASGMYADPTAGLRKCVAKCTDGLYSNPLSGRCEASCPLGFWAQDVINQCVQVCTGSLFADNSTGKCETSCPSPTYADPSTSRCVKTCPAPTYGEVDNTCVSMCALPNYANPLTQRCQPNCPPFDYLFAENTTAACVSSCGIVSDSYADRNTNQCVSNCTLANEYALASTAICTSLCPDGLFMENSTKKCVATCLTGSAEPTSRYCVARCFGNPQTFSYNKVCHYICLNGSHTLFADNSTNDCVVTCPTNPDFYSDPLTGNCVHFCPDGYFAENGTRTCTANCDPDEFADNLTRRCVATCPTASQQTYGDSTTNKCVRVCPPGMVARNDTQLCVATTQCPGSTWSDMISKHCVARCPVQPVHFGNNGTTTCVGRCPMGLFGDYQSQTCVSACYVDAAGEYRFADPVTQTCVLVCPILNNLYGDTQVSGNFTCVSSCSNGQLRDNSTQRCVATCPSQPSYWADTISENCVYFCPPSYFASNQTDRLCVANCSAYSNHYADLVSQICTTLCPENTWADNISYSCLSECPSSPDYYADNVSRTCVFNCPKGSDWVTFADSTTRRCVTKCPSGWFGVNSTQRCQTGCPTNEYADPIIRVCVADCTVRPHYYKHNNLSCVYECPTAPVMAYKHQLNNSCVYTDGSGNTGCPSNYWANPVNNYCTTLCPHGYFADQTKHLCVQVCPIGQFADDTDRKCKSACSTVPEQYRLDMNPGVCVQFCPSPLFADNNTFDCVEKCNNTAQGNMYSYEPTRICVLHCQPPYFAYLPDHICMLECPTSYFARDSDRTCQTTCNSPYFADDSTKTCVLICPENPIYFGHNNVCIGSCPDGYYEDNSTRMCVTDCPSQPLTFADNSTNKCVFTCPSSPNYYANNITRICVFNCPNGTFTDSVSRTCVTKCPEDLNTYADPTTNACQPACPSPYFASDLNKQCVLQCPFTPTKTYARTTGRVCVETCPNTFYAENISRTCVSGCPTDLTAFADTTSNVCVSTCPYGWFARNDTYACSQQCPMNSFADNHTRKCLSACPGTERLYADSTTWTCVSQCPTGYYGNDQNWTCISTCPEAVYGYKLDLSNLCIEECPDPFFAYVPTRTCVTNCGAGLFGDSATRICKDCPSQCPTCLSLTECLTCNSTLYLSFGSCVASCPAGTYANDDSMTCVYATGCPSGQYGRNDTDVCSTTCPAKQYANATTKMCENCPDTCDNCISQTNCSTCIATAVYSSITNLCYQFCNSTTRYRYNSQCFDACPAGTYLDFTAVNCQACNTLCQTCSQSAVNCTSCTTRFLHQNSCIQQCPSGFYGSNKTCLACTASVSACSDPLTFDVVPRVENFQNVVYLKFNKKATVQGRPEDFISLDLTPQRLLQTSLVNGGLPFTSEVLDDGTIKLILSSDISLTNPSFTIKINDPSMITSEGGESLQSLEAQLNDIVINSYPQGTTSDAPLVVAGTVLSIVMMVLLFSVILCTPISTYLAIETFHIMAFLAFINELPPNYFYFLKELTISRMSFLPNIFDNVYSTPSTFNESTPTRVIQIDQKASFTQTAGQYTFFLLIYLFVGFIIWALTTKKNSNRPLRELAQKVWNTRVRFGMINDILWVYGVNVYVEGFMQFHYPYDGGDVALAVISLLLFLALTIVMFIHRCKFYDPQEQQGASEYYKLWTEGVKQGTIYQYTAFIYYLRRILFAVIIVATINSTSDVQCIPLITLFSLMLVALVIIRPFQDHLRNIIHIANEVGLIFMVSGMLFYKGYVDAGEPTGTKTTCGQILTIVCIAHLSILIIWSMFRIYNFYKELWGEFTKTEFYLLYLDEKYDDNIEKELQELNDETDGEVQSVELTKDLEGESREEGDEIIRLKIKRRRKIQKKKPMMEEQIPRVNRRQGQYLRLEAINQPDNTVSEIDIKESKPASKPKFQRMNIGETEKVAVAPKPEPQKKSELPNDWEQVQLQPQEQPQPVIFDPLINNSDVPSEQNDDFESVHHDQLLSEPQPEESKVVQPEVKPAPEGNLVDMSEISSVSNHDQVISKEESDNLRESLKEIGSEKHSEEAASFNSPRNQQPPEPQEPVGNFMKKEKEQSPADQWQPMPPINDHPAPEPAPVEPSHGNWVEQPEQPPQEEVAEQPKPEPKPNNAWDMEIEDILQEQERNKEKKDKNMMLLFDEEDFDL